MQSPFCFVILSCFLGKPLHCGRKSLLNCHFETFRKGFVLVAFESEIVHGKVVEVGNVFVHHKLWCWMGCAFEHTLNLWDVAIVDVAIGNYVNKFAHLKSAYLRQHMHQNGILHYVPVVGYRHIIGALVQDGVEFAIHHVESYRISTGIKVHFAQILVYVDVGNDATAVRVVF